ncbi:Glycine betaine/carnitine/choline-binding protein OpuCC precursor [Aquisphaera giovannonii]|uniref:Glycine betaine/carnitine/choline-binding protein OpuCC n=1 Tax=Aquisphaera giovannonii TaxID=406548 RepID=A0A5B9W143_9BACT|nr:ABC transporter permease/substrate-binding protein [Aquisphaera giovannonii]QEH33670.1 Glycine betaine/carnitine/choline-binding protein OpuCC precursor [Aquisphaera giovannonii]
MADGWLALLMAERWSLLEAAAAHLALVAEAVALAAMVGLPAGIVAARRPTFGRIALGIANILQTIPSLALLGFLLILFRGQIGQPPALAALALYALLPIVKNTMVGLRGIDPGIREASLALGMTAWQRLALVDLPLAMPVIMGGLRVATVASVGMATIAAAIGARGLGGYIFRGVALSDTRLILLGSVPAALLALAFDAALGEVETRLDPGRPRRSRSRAIASALALAAAAAFAAWGLWRENRPTGGGARQATIVIGSKDGSEMIILGHMLAELVEARTDLRVDRRLNLGGTLVCYNGLRLGGLDAYVEYTGTALTTILKQPVERDPGLVLERVRAGTGRDEVACLDPLGFENTFAILMKRERAERLGIRRISDLRGHQRDLRAGFGPEFMNRPDGYRGLLQAYGLSFGQAPRELDRNLLYQAIVQGSLDVAAGDSTDGRIAAFDLVQLEDDRRYFPPYEAVPLARAKTLEEHAGLREALNALAGAIDAPAMRGLNRQVDEHRKRPEDVAHAFLVERGLIPSSGRTD